MSADTLVNGRRAMPCRPRTGPATVRSDHHRRDGRARWLPLHLARRRGCARLDRAARTRIIGAVGALRQITQPVVKRPEPRIARARLPPSGGVSRVLSRHAWPAAPPSWRLGLSPLRLGENPRLAGLKHLNRLEQVLAQRERPLELDEVVMQSHSGEVISGSMSNLFLVEGEQLVTPALDYCGVEGVMRRLVLESAPAAGWRISIEAVSVARRRTGTLFVPTCA
jgi:4-amino-4-deoxychorismate lyase